MARRRGRPLASVTTTAGTIPEQATAEMSRPVTPAVCKASGITARTLSHQHPGSALGPAGMVGPQFRRWEDSEITPTPGVGHHRLGSGGAEVDPEGERGRAGGGRPRRGAGGRQPADPSWRVPLPSRPWPSPLTRVASRAWTRRPRPSVALDDGLSK